MNRCPHFQNVPVDTLAAALLWWNTASPVALYIRESNRDAGLRQSADMEPITKGFECLPSSVTGSDVWIADGSPNSFACSGKRRWAYRRQIASSRNYLRRLVGMNGICTATTTRRSSAGRISLASFPTTGRGAMSATAQKLHAKTADSVEGGRAGRTSGENGPVTVANPNSRDAGNLLFLILPPEIR